MRSPSESAKASEIAAQKASGLANARTVETMAPVDDAPETQERIRSGEITTAAEARREALKETGKDEPDQVPVLQPQSAYRHLGTALRQVMDAGNAIRDGRKGDVPSDKLLERIREISTELERVEQLLDGR